MRVSIPLRIVVTMSVIVTCATLNRVLSPPLLLEQAHRRPYRTGQTAYPSAGWFDNHTQLDLRKVEGTEHWSVVLRDVDTNREVPLEPFNSRFASQLIPGKSPTHQKSKYESEHPYPGWHSFSPDGKWLIWDRIDRSDHGRLVSATFDVFPLYPQSTPQNFPPVQHFIRSLATSGYFEEPVWFSDSRRWIEMTTDDNGRVNGVVIHDIQNPNLIVTKKFSTLGGRLPIQITAENHLRTYDPNYPTDTAAAKGKQAYWDTPLDDPFPESRLVFISLGAGWAHTMHHSPDGKYLLWHIGLQNQFPFRWSRYGMWESLWLSKADGSDMHELGCIFKDSLPIPSTRYRDSWGYDCLTDIFWLPDGKHIQFSIDEFEGEGADRNVYTLDIN